MHKKNLFIFFAVLIIFKHTSSEAQSFQRYTSQDGLPVMNLSSITEDKHGNLWLGTYYVGVVKYDGKNFISFPNEERFNFLTHSIFNHPSHSDTIVAVSSEEYRTINIYTHKDRNSAIPGNKKIHKAIVDKVGREILLLTVNGEILSQQNGYKVLYEGVRHIISLDSSTIFIHRDSLHIKTTSGTVSQKIPTSINIIKDAVAYNQGYLLVTNNGLEHLINGEFLPVYKKINSFHSIFIYENEIFLGDTEGLLKLNTSDTSLVCYSKLWPGFSFLKDKEGILWITSSSGGLYKKMLHDFESIYLPKDPEDGVFSVQANDKNIFFGGKGLKVMDAQNHQVTDAKLHNTNVRAMSLIDDKLYVGASRDLWEYDIQSKSLTKVLDSILVLSMHIVDSTLYIGTMNGLLYKYQTDSEIVERYKIERGQAINAIQTLSDKELVVGTSKGMHVVDRDNGEILKTFVDNHSILNLSVINDSVVFINRFGIDLKIYDIKNDRALNSLSNKNYLSSNIIYFIQPYKDGTYWIGTSNSVVHIKLSEDYEIIKSTIYNKHNGFDGSETNSNASFIAEDVLYFGTVNGIKATNAIPNTRYQTNDLHIKYLVINQKDTLVNSGNNSFTLDPGVESLVIHYDQVDKNNGVLQFEGTLVNYTNLPVSTKSKSMEYYNLKTGDYTFRLNSRIDHVAAGRLKAAIYIKPFFYEAEWFIGFMIFLGVTFVILLIYFFNEYKMNKVERAEKRRQLEKKEIMKWLSMDFHDDLGNKLARLLQFINVFEIASDENQKVSLINKIKNELRFIYNDSRQYIYSIDPEYTSAYSLFINLKSFGRELFKEKNVKINFDFTGSKDVKVDPKSYAHLLKIFKEGITNSFKYSGATNINCMIEVSADSIIMTLHDNGIGFTENSKNALGAGLINMKKRADSIKASLNIFSNSITGGTRIQLELKF